jgi:hypothetical protein
LENQTTDQEIVDYLLGELGEPEQLRVEENLFKSDEFFDRVAAIENRLVDLYALGKLSEANRKRFEEKYLTTPRRHAAVEASACYVGLLNESSRRRPVGARATWWEFLRSFLSDRNMAVQFSLAALLLVTMAAGLLLLAERARLKKRADASEAALRQKEEELQRQLELSRRQNAEHQADLERARQQGLAQSNREADGRPQDETAHSPSPPDTGLARRSPTPTFATLVLSPGLRSGSSPTKELIIKPGDKFVRLLVYLTGEPATRYRVSLQDDNANEVWTKTLSKTNQTPVGRRLSVQVPVDLFTNKDYVVKVEGIKQGGLPTRPVEYPLRVRNEKLNR